MQTRSLPLADRIFNPPTGPLPWAKTLAGILPLLFFCLAIMVEGFPRPPFSIPVATGFAIAGLAVSLLFLLLRWVPVSAFLYALLLPYFLLGSFDEITTTYKTPLIAAMAAFAVLGLVFSQRKVTIFPRWLLLAAAGMLILLLASIPARNFWQLTSDLGVQRCFLDARGCPALPADAPPWWMLFFRF